MNEIKVDFESWLMDKYVEAENPLDDDIPDGFNYWLENLDIQDFLDYGQLYAKVIVKMIKNKIEKE